MLGFILASYILPEEVWFVDLLTWLNICSFLLLIVFHSPHSWPNFLQILTSFQFVLILTKDAGIYLRSTSVRAQSCGASIFLTWINLCSESVSISSLFKFFCLNIDPSWSSFYVYYSYFDFGTLMLLAKIGVIHLVFKPCMFILVFCVTSPNNVRPKETVFDEKWFLVQKYTVVTKWRFKIW